MIIIVPLENHLKHHPLYKPYLERAIWVQDMIEVLIPHIKQLFPDLPNVRVFVKPMKAKGTFASHFYGPGVSHSIHIDHRRIKSVYHFIDTVIHEFCHAWQIHTGSLAFNGQISRVWNKTEVYPVKAYTHQAYLDRPWEVQARKIASENAQRILDIIMLTSHTKSLILN